MKIVADTDILSIFAKTGRLDILGKLFDQVVIPQSVQSELSKGGVDVKPLNPTLAQLAKAELKALKETDARLDRGERECFVIARNRSLPLASNEKIVHSLCRKESIGYLTLPRILRLAITEGAISREEGKRLVKLIEEEENTIIKNKDEIFK